MWLQLMSRFQAAQNQIKELHKRLEQMETQVCFFIFQNYFFHTVTFRTPPRISCHTDLYYLIFFFFTQNTGLNTENFRLKKNISALLKTARQEVIRKDAEIQRLNQM